MSEYLDETGLAYFWNKIKSWFLGKTETAAKTYSVWYGEVDSTSTSTAYTATVTGLTSLYDGVCVVLKNGVVTSAAGFTIDVNGLGAKPVYTNLAAATAETTKFNVAYTLMFIYDSTRVNGGCWVCYNGYDSNTNTIGYQLCTNSTLRPAADRGYRYRLWFTSADGKKWVPANTSTSTNATASRTPNTTPIDPFGEIIYYSTNGTTQENANLGATACWQQYTLTLGYSFNTTGAALSLTYPSPVYIKCSPQTNGSAALQGYVQSLPSSDDGFIYIFLGMAYGAQTVELFPVHPVYWHDGTGIRIWTGKRIPTKTSDLTNDSGYITDAGVTSFNGSTGAVTYSAPVSSVNGQTGAVTVSVPTKTSDLTNDSGYITDAGVTSFNNQTGAVTYTAPVTSVNGSTGAVTVSVPTKTSDLTNDSGYITDAGVTSFNGATGAVTYIPPVTSVNGNTGAVTVQDTLVSGTNIKTINNTSILGSGNISISGGTSVDPATAPPLMDGTSAVGSSTKYAREDHVHPTDTSRQETLVSGTNIKTINNASVLGSGNISIPVPQPGTDYYPMLGAAPGSDVDGANATGIYTYTSSYDNVPSASGGTIMVTETGTYIKQIAFANQASGTPMIYVRTTDSNAAWQGWERLAFISDLPGISVDVAALTATSTSVATISGLACRRYGKVCTLVGYITAVNLTTTLTTVTTLPAGYRPTNAVALSFYSTVTALSDSNGIVNTNGTVQVRLSSARTSGNIYIHAAWVLAA